MGKDILSSDGLSNRKKQILRSIIETHISSGEPIGSKYLVSSGDIPFSSATIRNEMAELEEMGYLEHIHTSSGRVPTNLGYRFYVDSLMENYKLTASEIVTLNNMLKNKIGELNTILQSASKLVASLTNYPTIAVQTDTESKSVDQFSHMLLDANSFLLVMRVSDGNVKTKHIRTDFEINDDILHQLIALLNKFVAGINPEQITLPIMMQMEKSLGSAGRLVDICIKAVYEVTVSNEDTNVRFEGVGKLLQYPEFSNVDKMREVLNMIEDKDSILDIMKDGEEDKVNVVIGKNDEKIVDDSAFIYKKVVVGGKVVGAIGVFGPSRMDYSKVVTTVDYLSEKISNAFKLQLNSPSEDEK
ncbi:MAG: heat-inducible transcriptional repressor HrcA [Clostridia bacterium]|nr:heat-inducible transcriptional repressor HrcA [Clostridia bacterium]